MLSLKTYRRAAVPLLAIQTSDPAEIVQLAIKEATIKETVYPVLLWDCIHGVCPGNQEAVTITNEINGNRPGAIATGNPVEFLQAIERLGDDANAIKTTIVALGMADILEGPGGSGAVAKQALWNLRDVLSKQGILLILTVPMGWGNPFPDDIAVAVSPLPGRSELGQIVKKICSDASVDEPKDAEKVGDALLGLSSFSAEQAVAMSISKEGINLESLWSRKRQQIGETPGLSVYDGKETFDDLGGLDQAKELFTSMLKGKRKPGCVVFVDEIEKALAGSSGDTSGVSQNMLGYLLSYMQDNNATGSIFVGPPGAAKSAFAKALGNEGTIPTITLDLGGIKGSLVGESESNMRKAMAVITAMSGGRPFFVATCNAISVLPPELRRRFTIGTMFFDLPSKEEQRVIWQIYLAKYNLKKQALPNSDGWTGAEIKQCADLADRLSITLIDAARYVVPVSVSAREKIQALRQEASGRYLSASGSGIYEYAVGSKSSRSIDFN